MIIIGERINSSRKRIARAIEEKDAGFLQKEAIMQVEAGADYVDVNAGAFAQKEAEYLEWLVKIVQQVIDKPLCIDSASPKALAAALTWHEGKAILNSITGQKERYDAVLPLLKEYSCGVVVLCMDDLGVPTTAKGKVDVASRIIRSLSAEGVALDDIYVDPLVHPISTDFNSGSLVLDTIEEIASSYPGVHTICGVSNISFGLPKRSQLNQIFIVLAKQRGLDAAIVDPCDRQLMAKILIANALMGRDEYCMDYINAYRQGRLG